MSELHVLDASAVLCVFNSEPGAERVRSVWRASVIGAVNLCEVATKLAESGLTPEEAGVAVRRLRLDVLPFDLKLAERAAALRPATRRLGLSLGDRACMALAIELGATAVTTDRAWADLDVGVKVLVLR